MSRLSFWLSIVGSIAIAYLALLLGLVSAGSATIAARQSESDAPPTTLNSQLWWWANKSPNHDVDGAYSNQFKLYVNGFDMGDLKFDSIGFESHCHEYRDWCVAHSDPQDPTLHFWYQGYNY
ncbi:hypothetical protein BGZ47_002110, partial [Haplosporangium gracile]